MTLFEINSDLIELNELLEEIGGDITDPRVESAIETWFGELHDSLGVKLDSYIGLIGQLDMEAVRAKAEADQWTAKAKARENRIAWLKKRLKQFMEATGKDRLTSHSGRIVSIQGNGGACPLVWFVDGAAVDDPLPAESLPPEFVVIKKEPDNKAIRKALDQGSPLGFVAYGSRGTQLRIR